MRTTTHKPVAGTGAATVVLPGGSRRVVGIARAWLRETLDSWDVPQEAADDLELIASELVTNAVVHTVSSQIEVRLLQRAGRVLIAVLDQGSRTSGIRLGDRLQSNDEISGRGLLLVAGYAHAWGQQRAGRGALVWATVRICGAATC